MNDWIEELLVNLDNSVDERIKQEILEKCGAKCPFSHMPNEKLIELRNQSGNEKAFLDKLCEIWRLKKENGKYYVIFDQCYCPLVNTKMKTASKTMCYCTLGSLKHKFSISLGRNINVEILKTVLRGDDECKFEIGIESP